MGGKGSQGEAQVGLLSRQRLIMITSGSGTSQGTIKADIGRDVGTNERFIHKYFTMAVVWLQSSMIRRPAKNALALIHSTNWHVRGSSSELWPIRQEEIWFVVNVTFQCRFVWCKLYTCMTDVWRQHWWQDCVLETLVLMRDSLYNHVSLNRACCHLLLGGRTSETNQYSHIDPLQL